jgi:hypothetical protein
LPDAAIKKTINIFVIGRQRSVTIELISTIAVQLTANAAAAFFTEKEKGRSLLCCREKRS